MTDITIRDATPGDIAIVAANNRAMALETEGKALDEATVLRGVTALIHDRSRGFYLLAERGGEVVGQLMVTYEWSDWRNGTFWWIQSVYIAPAARRTGVYRALHARVLSMAAKDGRVCGLRLYVDRANARAQATYAALGMERAHYELYEVDFVLGGSSGGRGTAGSERHEA